MRPLLLATAIVLTALGSGCSPSSGEAPEPPATPAGAGPEAETEPTEEAVPEAETEVVEVYREFTAAYDTVLQTGDGDTTPVSPYVRGDARTEALGFIASAAEQGIVQEGAVTVESITVESIEDTAGGSAELRACLDASTYTFVKDGAALGEPGGRVVSAVALREQDGSWMIESIEPQPEESC